jgi:hypothetical protein
MPVETDDVTNTGEAIGVQYRLTYTTRDRD